MILVKTAAGQQVLKDRSVPLTPVQRAAFILFDGKRDLAEVLKSTAAMGVTQADVDQLLALGLLAGPPEPAQEAAVPGSGRTPQERFAEAYPIASKLSAGLGLRGFRLNLAVEGATSYEQLLEVSEKIREAVGEKNFAPLERALKG